MLGRTTVDDRHAIHNELPGKLLAADVARHVLYNRTPSNLQIHHDELESKQKSMMIHGSQPSRCGCQVVVRCFTTLEFEPGPFPKSELMCSSQRVLHTLCFFPLALAEGHHSFIWRRRVALSSLA